MLGRLKVFLILAAVRHRARPFWLISFQRKSTSLRDRLLSMSSATALILEVVKERGR